MKPQNHVDPALHDALVSVWKQALIERARTVKLGERTWPVRRTPKRDLAQVDFQSAGQEIPGLQQNPQTQSRWAQLARKGAKVMPFLSGGRYLAAVSDGKITHYGR